MKGQRWRDGIQAQLSDGESLKVDKETKVVLGTKDRMVGEKNDLDLALMKLMI
jgi:hypothetical protein